MDRAHVEDVFPEVTEISDPDLRDGVCAAWTTAMADNGIEDLRTLPWFPPVEEALGLADESLVEHVRDVTASAVALAETLVDRRGDPVSIDTVVAGALIHDVSKCYEFDGTEKTTVGNLLGHPYYGVHVAADAGLPVECAHIALSHTSRTNVEPATLEAEIVRRADEVAAAAIRVTGVEDLREA